LVQQSGAKSDRFDHVITTELKPNTFPGSVYQLAWEDTDGGGDRDFNDLIVVVRVAVDADGDGLWDDWETDGTDTDGDGVPDFDLKSFDTDVARQASPRHKDIFVVYDYMGCSNNAPKCAGGHTHEPLAGALQDVIDAFSKAPVDNPDETAGINIHFVRGKEVPHTDFLGLSSCNGASIKAGTSKDFDDYKKTYSDGKLRFAFHYMILAHQQEPNNTSSGCAELPGNDFLITLGGWQGDTGTRMQQAGTIMHELGHNLGLHHGGGDDNNNKPNYLSVMSYAFQTVGITTQKSLEMQRFPNGSPTTQFLGTTNVLDYSREAQPSLDESKLDEFDPWKETLPRVEEFSSLRETDGSTTRYIGRGRDGHC